MAPIFTSEDVGALLAAFPPSTPTKDRPSLVRSLSGNALLSSKKALARFRMLLETGSGRISLREISSRLNVKETSWLFDCYDGTIHYSHDKQSILTSAEVYSVIDKLMSRTRELFVSLSSFAKEYDIALKSLVSIVYKNGMLHHFTHPKHSESNVVAQHDLVDSTKSELTRLMRDARDEKVVLNSCLPSVPHFVLRWLVQDIQANAEDMGGVLEEGRDGLVFVPAAFYDLREQRREDNQKAAVQSAVKALQEDGFCLLPAENEHNRCELERNVREDYSSASTLGDLSETTYTTKDGSKVIARHSVLETCLDQARECVKKALSKCSTAKDQSAMNLEVEKDVIANSSMPDLARLLLTTSFRQEIERVLHSEVLKLDEQRQAELVAAFQWTVLAPLKLYQAGLFHDADLRERQEAYLAEYVRSDVLSHFAETAYQKDQYLSTKVMREKTDKLVQKCKQIQRLTEINSAVDKFVQKQGIAQPDAGQLEQVKRDILKQKVKVVQKMTRGSDVLQNLVWILLAKAGGGLYMSAGKDTSRMIKQYQLVGDARTGQKLEKWRDLLKASGHNMHVTQEMKDMTKGAVEAMYGAEVSG